MLDLESAIKHCEEAAEKNETIGKMIQNNFSKLRREQKQEIDSCLECAKEHQQLAEWLRKLKAYESDDEICKYCTHTHDANYCNMCKHNTIFVDYFDLEGNTDE